MLFMVWEVAFFCGGECNTIGRSVDMREVMTTHIHKGTRGLSCNYMIAVFPFTTFFNICAHGFRYSIHLTCCSNLSPISSLSLVEKMLL